MSYKGALVIRKYEKADREPIRKICCDTAFMGGSMERFFGDREILADFVTLYYTDYEPESTFVAEINKEVIGYLTGCKSSKWHKRIFTMKILPRMVVKSFLKRIIFKVKTRSFVFSYFKSFLRGEFNRPDFSKDYPASLHINIDYRFRNLGIGAELIQRYLHYLELEKIEGVHLVTLKVRGFFEKLGFTALYCRKVSYYRYLINEDLFLTILGKKLRGIKK